MNKTYQEPSVEFISLIPQDEITNIIDGNVGVESAGGLFC